MCPFCKWYFSTVPQRTTVYKKDSSTKCSWPGYYNLRLHCSRYGKDLTLKFALQYRKYTFKLEQSQLHLLSVPTCIIQFHSSSSRNQHKKLSKKAFQLINPHDKLLQSSILYILYILYISYYIYIYLDMLAIVADIQLFSIVLLGNIMQLPIWTGFL